jgi:hypothetical protein
MTNQIWITSSIAFAMLFGVALVAQDNPLGAEVENADIAGLPAARGIYFHSGDRWVALQLTVLMPFTEGKAAILEILNVGSDHAIAAIPGAHADVQIADNTRPIFYLRGIRPTQMYLVRAVTKVDYRQLLMPVSRNFQEWAQLRPADVANLKLQAVAADVVTVKPLGDLKLGEYVLTSVFEPGARWIRLGYDFGLLGGRAGKIN